LRWPTLPKPTGAGIGNGGVREMATGNGRNEDEAEMHFRKARKMAQNLSDKVFEAKTLDALIALKTRASRFCRSERTANRSASIERPILSLEREQIVKSLEVQFDVSEKDRKLKLLTKEREISRLMNLILVIGLIVLVLLFALAYLFLKRINKKDRQLLKTKKNSYGTGKPETAQRATVPE
jgi:hypothetical protein